MSTSNPLRLQVPNNHILTQNLYYSYYSPKPKYPIIGYLDPVGSFFQVKPLGHSPDKYWLDLTEGSCLRSALDIANPLVQ